MMIQIIQSKNIQLSQNEMQAIRRIIAPFSTLNAQYLLNKNKNAVRFHSQNLNWNFEQLNYHAFGFIKGLTSLDLSSTHNFLIRALPSQQAEAYVTKIGVSGIGAKLFVSKAQTAAELDKELQQNNISCVIFEPNVQLENNTLIDTLNNLATELPSHGLGAPLKLSKYPHLKKLIQLNHYSFPGVYKFRAVMNYTSDKYLKVDPVNVQPIVLPSSSNTIIITDPADEFAFRAGILNSVVNGRYVHVVEPSQVAEVCAQVYNNKVDLIGTSETQVDAGVNVIVQRGSNLFSTHQNRVEV